MARAVLLLGALAALLGGSTVAAGAQPKRPKPLVVVQANVGNIDVGCVDQVFKLCLGPVERRASKALRALHPDIVGFEEVLPEATCRANPSSAPDNVCAHRRSPTEQPLRLLGKGYRVSCATRFGYECLAVRRASGVRATKLSTRKVVKPCTDRGFTMNRAVLRVRGRRVALLLGHPDSSHVACRAAQVRDAFGTLPQRGAVLALGDFNLDPFREHDASVRAFDAARRRLRLRLVDGRKITLRPGTSMTDPTGHSLDTKPLTQLPPSYSNRAIDHVLVRGWTGTCRVQRIDGGGGMDHRAQVCRLGLR